MHTGKCPKCEAVLDRVEVEELPAAAAKVWRSVAYLCPKCKTILSVQIDPIALRGDLNKHVSQEKDELLAELRRVKAQLSHIDQKLR